MGLRRGLQCLADKGYENLPGDIGFVAVELLGVLGEQLVFLGGELERHGDTPLVFRGDREQV